MPDENERSLAAVIAELKDELKLFLETRYSMLAAEMRDKLAAMKFGMPMLAVGALMLVTAWLLFVGAAVAAIYVAFLGNAFAGALALLVMGIACAVGGGVAVLFAYRGLSDTGIVPRRTIRVLKQDRIWLNQEVRMQR